ncbi:hypothetical protein AC579_8574 [Pseudocercospora musae]|uniref:Major facilitator superfamily (MFS) profile domain-containing protein n=1 Tax=Pseudocercospora musae TaxID=113226 RepID=A0A139IBH5_9PEZI|nr:hypothetical protein AC579_8574 [Pseudocercospora musae]
MSIQMESTPHLTSLCSYVALDSVGRGGCGLFGSLVQPTFLSYFDNPSPSSIGGVVAAFSAGACFGALSSALISDRYGRLWGLRIGSLIAVIGAALQAGAVHVSKIQTLLTTNDSLTHR